MKIGRPIIDLTGKRIGRWTVVRFYGSNGTTTKWWCRCDCGVERAVDGGNLRGDGSKSCGCYRRDIAGVMTLTHGHTRNRTESATHKTWRAMIVRCTKPKSIGWHRYGGRGIEVCERWLSNFEAFLEDMGERPNKTTLDRVDPDGDYEPSNCRWATSKEQNRNRRNNVINIVGVSLLRHMRRRGVHAKDLAHAFGIFEEHVYAIARGDAWSGQ